MNNGCGSSATTTVTVGADLTGTNNVASASGFSIFPNPAANAANLLLNLDASESSVVVSINDASGRLVSTKEINDVRSGAVVGLDVDKLANGVYQVTVEGTNFKNVGRLTIAK
jgi:flagellar hook assembly protein FlgD